MNKFLVGVIVALLVSIFWAFGAYNSIIALDQAVKTKWADVGGQYQRRMDLIPNLVQIVKGATDFEQKTLTQIVEARAKATQVVVDPNKLDAESIQKFQRAQGEVGTALGRLLAISENYPQLRATESFRDLSSQLEGTENRIVVARKDFNNAVKEYNTRTLQFPGNILAKLFGFEGKAYFASDEGAGKAPTIKF